MWFMLTVAMETLPKGNATTATTDTLDAATSAAADPMPTYQDAHPPLPTDYRVKLDA